MHCCSRAAEEAQPGCPEPQPQLLRRRADLRCPRGPPGQGTFPGRSRRRGSTASPSPASRRAPCCARSRAPRPRRPALRPFDVRRNATVHLSCADRRGTAAFPQRAALKPRRFGFVQVVDWFAQILAAMRYLHETHRILHRDLKVRPEIEIELKTPVAWLCTTSGCPCAPGPWTELLRRGCAATSSSAPLPPSGAEHLPGAAEGGRRARLGRRAGAHGRAAARGSPRGAHPLSLPEAGPR
jgi:hypothetical protein